MRVSVRQKLVISFSIVNTLLCLIGGFGVYNLSKMNKEFDILYETHLKGIEHIKDVHLNLISIEKERGMLLLAPDEKTKEDSISNLQLSLEQFTSNLTLFENTIVAKEAVDTFSEIVTLANELEENEHKVINLAKSSSIEEAYAQSLQNSLLTDQIEPKINYLVELKNKLAEEANIESEQVYSITSKLLGTLTVLGLATGLTVAFYLARVVTRPVARMAVATQRIADGDLTVDKVEAMSNDEVGDLANSFNTMVEVLRSVIGNTLSASELLASSSEQLSASSEETAVASEEVSKTINELATGASRQAEDSLSMSMTINEMAASIQTVANNANTVSNVSVDVAHGASNGLTEVRRAVEKIQQIKDVTSTSVRGVSKLGDASNKIGEIVEVIKEISDQTNILALNAAIEAARAGEHGQGFAVVAEEVRRLAAESTSSALQISDLINNIQVETGQVITSMDKTMNEVIDGVEAVNKAGETFEMIVKNINNITTEIQQISQTVQDIASGSKVVIESTDNIAAIAEQSAASSEEISAAAEEQTAAMDEVTRAALELSKLAEQLQMNVASFKL